MATDKPDPTLDNQPDSDDDLDDLDDVLSQFTPAPKAAPQSPLTPPPAPPSTATAAAFQRPRTNTRVDAPPRSVPGSGPAPGLDAASEADEDALSAEFSRELARGMENLMREIGAGEGPAAEGGGGDEEAQRAFRAAWEAMLVEGMDGVGGADLAGLGEPMARGRGDAAGAAPAQGGETNAFQSKIKQAMDKLRQSESDLQDSTTGQGDSLNGESPDALAALLASLGDLGDEGPESEAELSGLLETMMKQLVSRDVLYDPLKELSESFPPYLANPPNPISPEDRIRYDSQLQCVRRILAVFDNPKYSEKDPAMMKDVSDLMNEMQSFGSPPQEVMGPLPPGMALGPDGMPQMGDCVVA